MERHSFRGKAHARPIGGDGLAAPAAAPPTPPETDEADVSLRDLFQGLLKDKWIILGVFLAALTAATLLTYFQAPRYEATSLIYVDSKGSSPQLGDMLGLDMGENSVDNEVEILRSRSIAEAVAIRLLALPTPRARPSVLVPESDEPPLTKDQVIERLREFYVTVRPVGREVDMVNVVVESTQPAEAALIANLYAEEYTDYNRRLSRQRFSASRAFLDEQVERFDSTLRTAEEDYNSFATGARAVAPDLEAEQLYTQITEMQRRQAELEIQAATSRREVSGYEAELRRLSPGLVDRIASLDDEVIAQSKTQVAGARAQLETIYATNPDVRDNPEALAGLSATSRKRITDLQAQIAALTAEIDERSARVVEGIVRGDGLALSGPSSRVPGVSASDQQLAPLQEISGRIITKRVELGGVEAALGIVRSNIAASTSALGGIPGQRVLLERLSRNLSSTQETYVEILKQLNEARIAEESELGYVTVVDRAVPPVEPVSPRVPLNLLLGALLGLLGGVGLVLARNAFDNRVRRPDDVRKLGLPVLTVVPDMRPMLQKEFEGRERITVDGQTYATSLVAILNPISPVAESYRRLRTNLQFSDPDHPAQVIVFTSPGPGEGKSVTAMNLAAAIAQGGRTVIYVDADLRRPVGHKMMSVAREPGLTDALFGGQGDDFDAYATAVDDLYLMPAGAKVANPAEVLGSQRMKELVAALRRRFDYVVIDTPPVLAVSDSVVVATIADAAVLVCSAGETTLPVLGRSVEALRDVGAPLAGVVLNRFNERRDGGYGYGYSYAYAYGETPEEAAEDGARAVKR